MRTLIAAAEPPERPPVTGSGWTYSGPGFTITFPGLPLTPPTTAATSVRMDLRRPPDPERNCAPTGFGRWGRFCRCRGQSLGIDSM
jgi:hypothetical protein